MNHQQKYYQGRIPACGVFCGGCPVYTRAKNPCPGAEINFKRCENCKTFHLCCKERNITYCFQCKTFPCYKFKRFTKSWMQYGQNLINNQELLSQIGMDEFLEHYNSKTSIMFSIRPATISDIPELSELYKNTVLSVNRKDYTAKEVEDWASCGDDLAHLQELFDEQHFIAAENEKSQIVGFASINDTGYMHSLFVHKDFQHQGIATLLYGALEKYAIEKGAEKITSEVSITAKPFFEKQGFVVDEEQKRKANKLYLTNYKMSKIIGGCAHCALQGLEP